MQLSFFLFEAWAEAGASCLCLGYLAELQGFSDRVQLATTDAPHLSGGALVWNSPSKTVSSSVQDPALNIRAVKEYVLIISVVINFDDLDRRLPCAGHPGWSIWGMDSEAFLQDWKERPERVHIVAPLPATTHALSSNMLYQPAPQGALPLSFAMLNQCHPQGALPVPSNTLYQPQTQDALLGCPNSSISHEGLPEILIKKRYGRSEQLEKN